MEILILDYLPNAKHFTENDFRNILLSLDLKTDYVIVGRELYRTIQIFPGAFNKDNSLYYPIGFDRKPVRIVFSDRSEDAVRIIRENWGEMGLEAHTST